MITHYTKRLPYLGISGVKHRDDLVTILSDLPATKGYVFAFGYLVTDATLAGERKTNHPERYPTPEEIRAMVPASSGDPRVLHLLHYCTKATGPNEPDLVQRLTRGMQDFTGLNGAQINSELPPKFGVFTRFVKITDMRVVAQLRPAAEMTAKDVERLFGAHVIQQSVSDILVDFSAGEGMAIDVEKAGRVITLLRSRFGVHVGIGVAGGIAPGNVDKLRPLVADFPGLSFAVESGVRDPKTDRFDAAAARTVLHELSAIVGG